MKPAKIWGGCSFFDGCSLAATIKKKDYLTLQIDTKDKRP
jgi:hypothetical protein